MVLDQVISLVTTHWQQDVSEVYVCTSFVQAHRQYLIPRYAQISVGGGMEDRQSTKNKYHSVWIVRKRLVRTVLIFTESSDQLSRATDRVPGLPTSPGYVQ